MSQPHLVRALGLHRVEWREVLRCFEVSAKEPFDVYNRELPEDWFA